MIDGEIDVIPRPRRRIGQALLVEQIFVQRKSADFSRIAFRLFAAPVANLDAFRRFHGVAPAVGEDSAPRSGRNDRRARHRRRTADRDNTAQPRPARQYRPSPQICRRSRSAPILGQREKNSRRPALSPLTVSHVALAEFQSLKTDSALLWKNAFFSGSDSGMRSMAATS